MLKNIRIYLRFLNQLINIYPMQLEKQVCTLEQAKKLKELGVKQESLFYHTSSEKWGVLPKTSIDFTGDPWSAFTAAELVQMNQNCYNIEYSEKNKNQYYSQTSIADDFSQVFTYYDTFAEACAAKLINSLEKGRISMDEVNNRLMS